MFYVYAKTGSCNIYNMSLLAGMPVPRTDFLDSSGEIVEKVKTIIAIEEKFIDVFSQTCKGNCEECECDDEKKDEIHEHHDLMILEHNSTIDSYMQEIDTMIYKKFGVDEFNKDIINKFLNANNFYVFPNDDDFQE